MFFLLYLELQRSDDDADNALWVCSSAGAAQRYPPGDQKGGTRKHATPTPLTPFGLLVADLSPLTTSLAPKCSQISDIIGFWKSLTLSCTISPFYLFSDTWLFIGCIFPNAPTSQFSHWLIPQSPPSYSEILYGCWVCASLVLQVFCQGLLVCSGLTWPFSERSSEALTLALEQGHASSIIWCIVVVAKNTHRALAFVAHALQEPSLARTVQHPRLWDIMPTSNIQDLCRYL